MYQIKRTIIIPNWHVMSLFPCLFAQVTRAPSFFSMQKDGDEQSSGKVDAAIATAMGLAAENETN